MPRQTRKNHPTRTTTIRTRSKAQLAVVDEKPQPTPDITHLARSPLSPKDLWPNRNNGNDDHEDELILSPRNPPVLSPNLHPPSQLGMKRGRSHSPSKPPSSPNLSSLRPHEAHTPSSNTMSPPHKRTRMAQTMEYTRAPRIHPSPQHSTFQLPQRSYPSLGTAASPSIHIAPTVILESSTPAHPIALDSHTLPTSRDLRPSTPLAEEDELLLSPNRGRKTSFELANTPSPITARSFNKAASPTPGTVLPAIVISELPKTPPARPSTPPQRAHFPNALLAVGPATSTSPSRPQAGSKLPTKTPVRQFTFNVPNVCSFSPLTPILPTPMVKATPLFTSAKQKGGLFGQLRFEGSSAVPSPRKDPAASPTKTRIPAPANPLPQKSAVAAMVAKTKLVNSPLKNKLKQGPRAGTGAREKSRLLGLHSGKAATSSAKRYLATNNGTTSTTPGRRKGNTIKALDGLGKALERLSLPRPSRPSNAFGHRHGDGDQVKETMTARPGPSGGPSLPRSSGVLDFRALMEDKTPGPGVGKLGLPMRRPGLFKTPASDLEPVAGSPVKKHAPDMTVDEKATDNIGPLLTASPLVLKEPPTPLTSPRVSEPRFSVNDLVLRMNGIPRKASETDQHETALSAAPTEPATSIGAAEPSGSQPPKIANAARVTEVSRALSMTIAQREDGKIAQRLASDRPTRAVRAASIVQRQQHEHVQAEQAKPRTNARMAGSLDVLRSCVAYVDIATEDNEDASGLFVDMLRGLGARVLAKPSRICTHLIFKNGSEETVVQWRVLPEPKPRVVGVGWVVECAEKRQMVPEKRFEVDLLSVSLAPRKRRKSFSLKA